jgi:hypothetical protein
MKNVSIEWMDVTKKMNDDAFDEDGNIDDLLSRMRSVGWLYKETDKTILLVQEFDEGDGIEAAIVRDWVVIPKVLILKTTYLTRKGAQDGKGNSG